MTTDTSQTQFLTYVYVKGHATDPDDRSVPGYYAIELTCDVDLDLDNLSPLQVNHAIDATLDEFHNNQGIEVLDDFEILVYLDDGSLLTYDESLEAENELFFAEHLGRVTKPDVLKKR